MNRQKSNARKMGRQAADIAERTKRDILEASLHCFANRGYKSTTLRDIAERANTTHGLLRHHFGSKDDLWKACIAFVADQVAELQLHVLEQVTPENALESLETLARTFIENAATYPDLWRMLTFEALKDSDRLDHVLEVVKPLHTRIAPLFDMVQKQGHFVNFNNDSFFLFVVSLGALPFAMSQFNKKLCGTDILSKKQREKHADLVIETLFRRSEGR